MFYWIFTGVLVCMICILLTLAGRKYDLLLTTYKAEVQVAFIMPASLFLIEKLQLMLRLQKPILHLRQKINAVYGSQAVSERTLLFVAFLLAIFILSITASGLLALLANGDTVVFVFGMVMSMFIPVLVYRKLDKQEKERSSIILLELPEFVNQFVLLVNAGETIQQAWVRSVQLKANQKSPLYDQLRESVHQLLNNESFAVVLERLSKRCNLQEMTLLTTTVMLNGKRGGHHLVEALQGLSAKLWEKRKAIAKLKGEEASSKLVFPMVIIFVTVMLIIAWPALQLM